MMKMDSESYKDWMSIFDEEVSKTWNAERDELKRLAMLIFAVKREFKGINNKLDEDFLLLRERFEGGDRSTKKNSLPLSSTDSGNSLVDVSKENQFILKSETDEEYYTSYSFDELESPDIFGNVLHRSLHSIDNLSLISASEDETNVQDSPVIKKKRKYSRKKLCSSPSFRFLENLERSPSDVYQKAKLSSHISDKRLESSALVEATPNTIQNYQIGFSKQILAPKQKQKTKNTKCSSSSTCVFPESTKDKNPKKELSNRLENFDCDMTVSNTSVKKDDEMGITQMLDLINENENNGSSINIAQNSTSVSKDKKVEAFEGNRKVNKQIDLLNKGGLNVFLAEANKVPHNVEPEPVVRGKNRRKLPGWACRKCEKFYMKQGLSLEELRQKMNDCSKHRGKFKPPEDTMPGFWDLNITPKM